MSEGARPAREIHPRAAAGIACAVIAMTLFAGQHGLTKLLIGDFPIWGLMAAHALSPLILVPLIIGSGHHPGDQVPHSNTGRAAAGGGSDPGARQPGRTDHAQPGY